MLYSLASGILKARGAAGKTVQQKIDAMADMKPYFSSIASLPVATAPAPAAAASPNQAAVSLPGGASSVVTPQPGGTDDASLPGGAAATAVTPQPFVAANPAAKTEAQPPVRDSEAPAVPA